jgi:hypothetical protein
MTVRLILGPKLGESRQEIYPLGHPLFDFAQTELKLNPIWLRLSQPPAFFLLRIEPLSLPF